MNYKYQEMKIDINPKNELIKWGPLEYKWFYGSFFVETLFQKVRFWIWPNCLMIAKNGRVVFILDQEEMFKVGSKYLKKYLLDNVEYQKYWNQYLVWLKDFSFFRKEMQKTDLHDLNNKQLYKLVKIYYQFNIQFWQIVNMPEISNYGGEIYLKKKLEKCYPDKVYEYMEILIAPNKPSFLQQEELDLLKIAKIKNKVEINKKIKNHAENYFWIHNSYGGNRCLDEKYFLLKLRKLTRNKNPQNLIKEIQDKLLANQQRKNNLIKSEKINQDILNISSVLSESIWWQDHRKGYIWWQNHYWDLIIVEIARRSKWKIEELLNCWPSELLDIIVGKDTDKKQIISRNQNFVLWIEKGVFYPSYDEKLVDKLLKDFFPVNNENVNGIKGIVVSKSNRKLVKGKVKIILDPFKDANKMKRGNILVTTITQPEFIVVMKKAKAIITDEGSMTCHAAVVSRELSIPCIVGTKIATKVLKDGDLVEVNANSGFIRRIK